MTRREVADLLGVSERTVGTYAQNGRLTVNYIPGKTSPVADFDPDEVGRLKLELGTVEVRKVAVADVATKPSNAIIPTSNFQPSNLGSAQVLAIQAEHLPELAEAVVKSLESNRAVSYQELAVRPLLTLTEAALLTGVSEKILRDAARVGELKARKIGRSQRVRQSDLKDWIDAHFA